MNLTYKKAFMNEHKIYVHIYTNKAGLMISEQPQKRFTDICLTLILANWFVNVIVVIRF